MDDIVTIQDDNMRIIAANKAALRFFQANVGELTTKGGLKEYPVTYKTKSGDTMSVLKSAKRIIPCGQELMLALIYDFTERQRAENDLRVSEERYRNFLGNIEDDYYEVTLAGTLLLESFNVPYLWIYQKGINWHKLPALYDSDLSRSTENWEPHQRIRLADNIQRWKKRYLGFDIFT